MCRNSAAIWRSSFIWHAGVLKQIGISQFWFQQVNPQSFLYILWKFGEIWSDSVVLGERSCMAGVAIIVTTLSSPIFAIGWGCWTLRWSVSFYKYSLGGGTTALRGLYARLCHTFLVFLIISLREKYLRLNWTDFQDVFLPCDAVLVQHMPSSCVCLSVCVCVSFTLRYSVLNQNG